MSNTSPNKNTQRKLSLTKNIRLNLKNKYIPQDFFSQSISIMTKRKSQIQGQSKIFTPIKKISCLERKIQEKQSQQFQILKKRLIRIKQKTSLQFQNQNYSLKSAKIIKNQKQFINKIISKQNFQIKKKESQNKKNKKGCSKKLMDYMQKMKNFINMDITFEQDKFISKPNKQKQNFQLIKNPQLIETDYSPKLIKQRPKSQINSRQRLIINQKNNQNIKKIVPKPIKIKVKDVNKIMKGTKQIKQKDHRYNKFIDIPLDRDGLLTFYGSSDTKSILMNSYSIRTSLPRLEK